MSPPPLQLLDAYAVPPCPWTARFRRFPVNYALILIFCLGLPMLCWFLLRSEPDLHIYPIGWVALPLFALVVGSILFTFGYASWQHLIAAFLPSNWAVQLGDQGIHVKYRSWLNWRLPETGPTVVFIPYAALTAVREVRERLDMKVKSHLKIRHFAFVALTPKPDVDLAPLDRAVRAELDRVPLGGPFLKTLQTWDDVPIYVDEHGEIRIAWLGGRFLRALSGHVTRARWQSLHTYGERILATGDEAAVRRHLLDIVLHGERIMAIQVLQFFADLRYDEASGRIQQLLRSGA